MITAYLFILFNSLKVMALFIAIIFLIKVARQIHYEAHRYDDEN